MWFVSEHLSQGRPARALGRAGGPGEAGAAALPQAGQGQPRRQEVQRENFV